MLMLQAEPAIHQASSSMTAPLRGISAREGARTQSLWAHRPGRMACPSRRCVETAKLMNLGPVDIEPAFSNAFVFRDRREELRRDASAILNNMDRRDADGRDARSKHPGALGCEPN